MLRLLRARLAAGAHDGGMALVAVVAAAAVLMIAVTVMLSSATNTTIRTRSDSDWNRAIAAAYAGLADYQSKLAADNSYQQYGNAAAAFSSSSTFSSNPGSAALATTAGGTWQNVLDSSTPPKPTGQSYRYEVDNSSYYATGVVRLRVTGRSGSTTRSLVADLKGTGFINYLYFTDYETSDPTLAGSSCTPQHLTDTGYTARTDCQRIQFASNDHLGGPVRTNDEFTICGATFDRAVESTAPNGGWVTPAGCGTPTFNPLVNNGTTKYVPSIALPATNANLMQETRSDLTSTTVPNPGCLYTGPTSITFLSDGRMTVRSPYTRATQIAGDPAASGTAPAMCGTPGTGTGALGSATGQTIKVPANNLVYVQNVPASSSDPNYWASGTRPAGFSCTGADGSTAGNGIGFPAKNETTSTIKTATPYACTTGDVFVKGTFKGAATVAAQNFVYITDDLLYSDKTSDLLGLVGQRAVWVYNPVTSSCVGSGYAQRCSVAPMSGYGAGMEIDAAIASNTGTFTVQNYDQGSANLGMLTVLGSIAQKFRGPVAQSAGAGVVSTGYVKNYLYDQRLQFKAPPKFLKPVSTTYSVTTQVEVRAAYSADGTPRYRADGSVLP